MVKPIEELLKKSHKVGIWGMGGVGKTTMAKVVFATLSSQYNHRCFLENVREETERKGLKHVRDSLVSKLLGKDMQIDSSNEEFVVGRLGRTKAFVVLDDVDTTGQLKNLQDNTCNFLGEGSKVVITTRDQKLIRGKGYEIHEAKGLSYENSRRLFIRKAFGSDNAEDGYEELIEEFVDYTKHNPLALEVLGLYVHSEDKKLWGDLLRKLQAGNPNEKIQEVLRLSYDRLDHKEKQIFLDIACFLKGESEEFVKELMESYEFYPTVGMQILKDKALIDTTGGKVEMHDLIQEMAYQIVREKSIDEPGKRSRLWDSREIYDVLKNCEGEKEVEGILMLDTFWMRPSDLTAKTFNKMTKLRFLKIYSSWVSSLSDFTMSTATGLESISTRIGYFHWEGYPMKSLPSNFRAEHLLELNLTGGKVETLWEGEQDLANLKRLTLGWCKYLRELPDFSKACRLENVYLRGCESLCYVHPSLLSLDSLISLDAWGCISLESLQSRSHVKSLKQVTLSGCENLKEFCVSSEELTSLDLSESKIEELSPSIGRCSKLTKLYLPDAKLKNLPIKVLSCLTFLDELKVSLVKIDNDDLRKLFDCLHRLQSLSLKKCCNLTELPDNIKQLSKLQYLSVKGCTALRSLPELPPSLRKLNATDCISLETVSASTISSTPQNYGGKVFSFMDCVKLDLGAIEEQAKWLLEKAIHEKEHVIVCYPGKKVPEWFGNNRSQKTLDALKLSLSSNTLVGFVFCCSDMPDSLEMGEVETFFCIEDDKISDEKAGFAELRKYGNVEYFTCGNVELGDFGSGNVLLRSYPEVCKMILEHIEGDIGKDEATNIFRKFSFYDRDSCKWEAYPIYSPGYSELNSNS